MKNFIIILSVITILAGTLSSTSVLAENSLGFAAGPTRGAGVTYRHLPDTGSEDSLGWQITGLPFITKESGFVSVGAAALWLLHRGNTGLAYASFGVGTVANWSNCVEEDIYCKEESNFGIGLGPGIGFELRLVENFGWSVDVPLAILFANGDFEGVYPIPNTALVYYW